MEKKLHQEIFALARKEKQTKKDPLTTYFDHMSSVPGCALNEELKKCKSKYTCVKPYF